MNAEDLAQKHWEYIKALLLAHGEMPGIVSKIGFHYVSAMVHGVKHGREGR